MMTRKLSDLDWRPVVQPSTLAPCAMPPWYEHALAARARECVRLAAGEIEIESVADWLIKDERGAWELEAMRLLLKTRNEPLASKVREQSLSDETVNIAVAERIAWLAVEATLRDALAKVAS